LVVFVSFVLVLPLVLETMAIEYEGEDEEDHHRPSGPLLLGDLPDEA
jgi:hypothetical protein